jgi:putative sugar O-methyltransferase
LVEIRDPRRAASYLLDKVVGLAAARSRDEDFVGSPGNRSVSDSGEWVPLVAKAARDFSVFSKFKSDPIYRKVLEHVTPEQGEKYLAIIEHQSPEFLEQFYRFKINDLIGTPIMHSYPGIGLISPTTLRYIKVASDLQKYFGFDIGKKIVEIGVGYGGQCLVNDQVFKVKEHHLYDLPPVLNLVERYLEAHVLNCAYMSSTLNQNSGDERYDLAISNYAFSELPSRVQSKYIEKILVNASKGYLTMNSGLETSAFTTDKLSIDELRRKLPPFEIFDEQPLTYPHNYIIVWGHKVRGNAI